MRQACPRSGADGINPWLDLVRSIAILLVLLRHGARALHPSSGEPRGFVETIFINGWVGVDLFFVLSGYLIAAHLIKRGIGSGAFSMGRYLAMRGLRILPAYLTVLGLIVAGGFPLYVVAPDALTTRIAYHLLFLQDYLPSNINTVFWSLGVEEKFYLLAPLLILVLLRARTVRLRALLLITAFSLPLAFRAALWDRWHEPIQYVAFFQWFRSPFHMALEGLVVGVAIAMAQNSGLIRESRGAGLAIFSASLAVLALWLGSHDFMAAIGLFDALAQPPLLALLAGGMTLGAVQLARTPMPLTPPIRGLSRLSYSLYLVHFPLIPLILHLTASRGAPVFWACYLAASFAAAFSLYLVIERPFLLLKDRIGRKQRRVADSALGLAAPSP